MESELPWARWIREFGHPVGLKTSMGILITGDDGNIYIACYHSRAYAIEVMIKDGCKEDVVTRIQSAFAGSNSQFGGVPLGSWPEGIAYEPDGQAAHRLSTGFGAPPLIPLEPIDQVFSSAKRNEADAWIRTNLGAERFSDFIEALDHKVWKATTIPLEYIISTPKIREKWGFCKSNIEFKAREIRLWNRDIDLARKRYDRTYVSQMSKAFKKNMSDKSVPAFYPAIWVASAGIAFLPSIADIDWDHESEVKRRRQAKVTSQHARENKDMNRSECAWEFDAWRDIFSKIRDDPLLAMDKHEAIFLEEKSLDTDASRRIMSLGVHTVRSRRIPDCTFGLSVGESTSSELLLNTNCLRSLFWHPESALISDPKWLSFHLAFPWAVYEAKKARSDPVLEQVQTASEIYLNILHDLCLQPGHPESPRGFQYGEKEQFQLFAMTSEGPNWRLFVYYRRLIPEFPLWLPDPSKMDRYDMKQIWQGDITNEEDAWQLHCLVDQIHRWAVEVFRPFILDRLRPWHAYRMASPIPSYVQSSVQTVQPSFDRHVQIISSSTPVGERFRMRMDPSFCRDTVESLDILDDQMSQQETTTTGSSETSQEQPWWSRYAKPEVARQRLLKGQNPQATFLQQTPKRRRRNTTGTRVADPSALREIRRHQEAYEAHQLRENEEKVESPRLWFQ